MSNKNRKLPFCLLLVLLAFILPTSQSFAQDSTATKHSKVITLAQADKMFAKQQYREALNAYSVHYKQTPNDQNLGYKIGLCYHYLLCRPDLCIKLFGNATNTASERYSFYSNKPSVTPLEAWYFLGKSYLAMNNVDSALKYFVYYQQKTTGKDQLDVTRQLKMCITNQELAQSPRQVGIHNIQQPINSNYNESNAVVSIDNKWMFFSSRKPSQQQNDVMGDNDIYISKAVDDSTWGQPEPFAYNTAGDDEPMCISTDGKKLYLRRADKHGGDIFVSEKEDTAWGKPHKLAGVNSPFDERGFAVSADGQWAVVSSNKPGGEGGYDLYYAEIKNGHFGALKNLGKQVNTVLDEIYPFIHPTEKKIYFSSNGNSKFGMGGFDLFYTQRDSAKTWAEPFTLGYPINKGGNEICYYVSSGGKRFYTALTRSGDMDVLEITSGKEDENKEDKLIEEKAESAPGNQEVAVVELMQVDKEKIVEKDKEVEVEKVQTVEKDVDKRVGTIAIEDTGKVDKIVAIETKEVVTETVVEKEVPAKKEDATKKGDTQPAAKDKGASGDKSATAEGAGNDEPVYYSVKPGATLYSIGREYDVTVEQLKQWNHLKNNNLVNGQQLIVGKGGSVAGKGPSVRELEKAGITEKERRAIADSIKAYYAQKISQEHSTVFKTLYFEFNSKELTLSKNELDLLVSFLLEHKDVNIEVLGHTDNTGEWEANFWMSRVRAKIVYDYLLAKNIDKNRIIFNGKGSTQPVASNQTAEGRSKNRRVEIILIE